MDIDSYLNSTFNSPLIEIHGRPSSAFVQTPLHHHRDIATGHHVHRKCPELEDFTGLRLFNKVRALGSPVRFPTRLSAWLVHLVPNGAEPEEAQHNTGYAGDEDLTDVSRGNEFDSHPVSCSHLRSDGELYKQLEHTSG